MPKLKRKIEIESSPENIYNIVKDDINTPIWNPSVTAVTPMDDDKIKLETDVGGITIIKTETDENKSATWYMEKSSINSMGYILTPKAHEIEVAIWVEFDNKKLSKLYKKTADIMLEGLKKIC